MADKKSKCASQCKQVDGKRECSIMKTDYATGTCHPYEKSDFDENSFFSKKSGKATITIGCPKNHFDSKTRRCSVGTRALKMTIES